MKRALSIFTAATLIVSTSLIHAATKTEEAVQSRTDAVVLWQNDTATREAATVHIRKYLRGPLTVAGAVQVALLNNRHLQATFEDIGIAKADVIDAVTLPNPSLDFEVQFPVVDGEMNRYGWLIAQEFAQILMIPLKKKIAEEQLEAAEMRVAAEVLDLVAEVKEAYFRVQADQQLLGRLKIVQETNAASLDLAQKQFKAGNVTDLELLQMQSAYSQGRMDIARAQTELAAHREEFNRLLGLWGAQTAWEIRGDLPPAPKFDVSMDHLESLAVSQRLDLSAAHRDLISVVSALGLTRVYRWVPVLDFGFSGERDIDGALNAGPAFRLELPIFNQGQARIARGESELRRAEAKFEALAVDIRSEVRQYRDQLLSLREQATFYHDDVLPTRIKVVNRSLLQYNAMQISPYALFVAKADELDTERGYIDTLRDYWIARVRLERAVGGTFTPHRVSQEGKKIVESTKP
ncbi:MAG: TolC family protein [Chthoniobacterales bacterium]|nr:TolC family protein [Chthoniobacterales bacterium]